MCITVGVAAEFRGDPGPTYSVPAPAAALRALCRSRRGPRPRKPNGYARPLTDLVAASTGH